LPRDFAEPIPYRCAGHSFGFTTNALRLLMVMGSAMLLHSGSISLRADCANLCWCGLFRQPYARVRRFRLPD
jgi:hypothetical protein